MVLKEVDYQIRAVNELYNKTEQLLNNGEDMSLLIFKAPTGSGKTIMTANYIQKLCNYLEAIKATHEMGYTLDDSMIKDIEKALEKAEEVREHETTYNC